MALPRGLSNLGKALNLNIQKDMDGKATMMKMCKPRKPTKLEKQEDKLLGGTPPVRWHQSPEDFEILYSYCMDDVEVEREADKELPDLSVAELQVWREDQYLNRRGVQIDVDACTAALGLINQYTVEANQDVERLSNGELTKVTSPLNVLRWAKSKGVDLPNFQKETVAEALKNGKLPEDVRGILRIRTQLGKTSTAKYKALKTGVDSHGILKELLVYCGASKTGRFAGKHFQVQNLPRGTIKDTNRCIETMKMRDLDIFSFLYPDVMDAISSCLRGMIIPRHGKDFVVVDWNAIEPRLLFWFAGEEAGLSKYRNNEDIYVDMAIHIFETEVINDKKRYIGKQGILLCGYGGGGKRRPDGSDAKFQSTCKSHGVEISDALSEKAVDTYRSVYSLVVDAWGICEKKAIEAVYTKVPVRCLKVVYHYEQENDFLICTLPSGRRLAYQSPRIERGKLSVMREKDFSYVRTKVWGGVLIENIIQGMGRDILIYGMQNAAKAGYPSVFHAHDELITEVGKGFGSVKELEEIVEQTPPWCMDVPLKAEGWRGERYEKR
jgi:DNA polymerase